MLFILFIIYLVLHLMVLGGHSWLPHAKYLSLQLFEPFLNLEDELFIFHYLNLKIDEFCLFGDYTQLR